MRLLVARCSVVYEGRLDASLPEATRLVMVKADGCVAIHADGGAYKPLNWMNAPNTLVEHDDRAGDEPLVARVERGARRLVHVHVEVEQGDRLAAVRAQPRRNRLAHVADDELVFREVRQRRAPPEDRRAG